MKKNNLIDFILKIDEKKLKKNFYQDLKIFCVLLIIFSTVCYTLLLPLEGNNIIDKLANLQEILNIDIDFQSVFKIFKLLIIPFILVACLILVACVIEIYFIYLRVNFKKDIFEIQKFTNPMNFKEDYYKIVYQKDKEFIDIEKLNIIIANITPSIINEYSTKRWFNLEEAEENLNIFRKHVREMKIFSPFSS